jgi:hypothetical protein
VRTWLFAFGAEIRTKTSAKLRLEHPERIHVILAATPTPPLRGDLAWPNADPAKIQQDLEVCHRNEQ